MNSIPLDTPQKQCPRCDKTLFLTIEYFTRDKSRQSGFFPICKECVNTKHPKKAKEEGYKRCPKCKQKLAYGDFSHSNQTKDGLQGWCKTCSKGYRDAHVVDDRVYRRNHHKKHRERISKQRHEHYMAIRETALQNHKQRYDANPEKALEAMRRYDQSPQGRLVRRALHQKRRARKKAIESNLTAQQIQIKLQAQKYRCYYCFTRFEEKNGKHIFHLEHTIPLSRTEHEPRHDVNYVVLACPTCNWHKKDKLPHEWPQGNRLF